MTGNYKLILFCRPPVAGKAKTRLGQFLGMERAAKVYGKMLNLVSGRFPGRQTILYSSTTEDLEVLQAHIAGETSNRTNKSSAAETPEIKIQVEADLGERMARAIIDTAREFPGEPALLAGTDIPDLSLDIIAEALALLGGQGREAKDLIFGPAKDGGYYLVGVNAAVAADETRMLSLFQDVPWSAPETLVKQEERGRALGLSVGRVAELADLDEIDDFLFMNKRTDFFAREFMPDIRVVLPVFNEIENLEFTLTPLLESGLFREIICADNGSTDGSIELARSLGARVTHCDIRGYGATVLKGLADIEERGGCEVVLFMDADGADDPTRLQDLLGPLVSDHKDMVIGARVARLADPGALLPQARMGNWLATFLMSIFWGYRYLDLGPYRALRWSALQRLEMDDMNFGWTIQMQVRAIRENLRIQEIPVRYRRRHAGMSKITANIGAAIKAGRIILWTIFKELRLKNRM